ncbi:hypothetical protein ABPG72_018508 [Tetrahymena utriculariae]
MSNNKSNKQIMLDLLRQSNKQLDLIPNSNLELTLEELSELNQIKNKLNTLKIINDFYPQKKKHINGSVQNGIHLHNMEQNLFNDLEERIQAFKQKIRSIDKYRIYILNQKALTKERSLYLLRSLINMAFQSSNLSIIYNSKKNQEQVHLFTTTEHFNIPNDDLKKISSELKAFLAGENKKEIIENSNERPDLECFSQYFGNKKYFFLKLNNSNIFIFEMEQTLFSYFLKLPFKNCFLIFNFMIDIINDISNSKIVKENLLSILHMTKFQYLKFSYEILKSIICELIRYHLQSDCDIINNGDSDNENQWDIITDQEKIYIPIGDSKFVQFILCIKNFKLNLFTFVERLTKQWRYFISMVSNFSSKEYTMEIIDSKNQNSLFFLFDKQRQLIYQPHPIPHEFDLFHIPENYQLGQQILLDDLIFEEENKRLIAKVIDELELGEKTFGNVDQKQYQIDIIPLRNQFNQIDSYLILTEDKKNQDEKAKIGKSRKNIYQEIEKYCQNLIEHYSLQENFTPQDLMNFLKDKSIEYKISTQLDITEEQYKDSYVVEYYHTDLPIKFKPRMLTLIPKFQESITRQGSFSSLQHQAIVNVPKELFKVNDTDVDLLSHWDFPYNQVATTEDKIRYAWSMFHLAGFMDKLKIDKDVFFKFLQLLQLKYDKRQNPFHNFQHAIAVSHATYFFINAKFLARYLDYLEQFTLLFSSLGHDVSHTGRTNAFEVATLSKLAIKFNDESVLENHHSSTLFKIIQKHNIFEQLQNEDVKNIRKYCISNILSTDMKKHQELTKQFEIKLTYLKQEGTDLIKSEADKKLMCGFLVHVADLTGPTKCFELAKEWSLRICKEFTLQVQEEEYLGLPVTPYLVGLESMEIISKQEGNFAKIIVLPLYSVLSEFAGPEFKQMVKNCENNISQWEKIHQEEKQKKETILTESINNVNGTK